MKQLSAFREEEILALHGIGPGSMPKLRRAMYEKGENSESELVSKWLGER